MTEKECCYRCGRVFSQLESRVLSAGKFYHTFCWDKVMQDKEKSHEELRDRHPERFF